MNPFKPEFFFNLETYRYADLFHETIYVWESLARIKNFILNQELGLIEGDVSSDAYLINPEQISIGSGTVIEPGAYIKGPCIIGKGCTVRHGAYIRGNVITGDQCVIGHTSEVKNSILLNGVKAAHFAYLGDSILGNDVNVGAGVKCANLRLDQGEVIIHYDGKRFPTGLKKFGAIMGDQASTGCNSVTNPGTLLGKRAVCHPCVNINGYIPEGYVVKYIGAQL